MRFLRIALVAMTALMFTVAGFGFLAHGTLNDSEGFARSMDRALADPVVQQEVKAAIRTSVSAAAEQAGADLGPLGSLAAAAGSDLLGETAAQIVDTQVFRNAWEDWARLIHRGLADAATGQPNPDVQVRGDSVEVQLAPLLTPLLTDSPISGLSGAVAGTLQDRSVTIETDERFAESLERLATFANARGALALGGILLLTATVLVGGSPLRWLAISLAATGASFLALAAGLNLTLNPDPGGPTPALASVILDSLSAGWDLSLLLAATLLLGAAALFEVLHRSRERDGPDSSGSDRLSTGAAH